MQQQLIPEHNSNTIELSSIDYNGQKIHFFSYNGQTWYFVRELTRAFKIETFRRFSGKTKVSEGMKMYVRVNDAMDYVEVLNKIGHVQDLLGISAGCQMGVKSISAGCQMASGRYEVVVLSEKGVIVAIQKSPYREQVLQQLGIANSDDALATSSTSSTVDAQTISVNLTTKVGRITINLTLNDKDSKQAKFIMEDIENITTQMLGGYRSRVDHISR